MMLQSFGVIQVCFVINGFCFLAFIFEATVIRCVIIKLYVSISVG